MSVNKVQDFYKILGVSRSATQGQIKRAYRTQAIKVHPDKTGGDDTRFKLLSDAYEILSNPSMRAEYDRTHTSDTDSTNTAVVKVKDKPRTKGSAGIELFNVPWGPTQALIVFALVWIGLPLLVIILAAMLAQYLPLAKSFYDGLAYTGPMTLNSLIASFVEVIIDAVAGLGLIYFFLRRYKVGWKAVGWRKFNLWKAIKILLIVFVAFLIGVTVLLALVSVLIPGFNANQTQSNDFTTNVAQQHRLISLFALVVIPPIIEETVFRGFIFPAFAKKWGTWAGAISSSILFGFAHLQANVSVYTFLLGMLLCYMYVKLKSVYPGMALHMLNNYLALMAITAK